MLITQPIKRNICESQYHSIDLEQDTVLPIQQKIHFANHALKKNLALKINYNK